MWGILDASRPADLLPATWEGVFARLQTEGYSAIEAAVNPQFCLFTGKEKEFNDVLKKYGLSLVGQVHTCSYPVRSRKVADHVRSFREQTQIAKDMGAVFVNSHSGCDSWTLEESLEFFRECIKIEKELGLTVCHETHRQRVFFQPWVTRDVLRALPELHVTADLSHFSVVCERIFDDGELDPEWPECLELIASRCKLIHARVGYAEGPQVCDPAAPEYKVELAAYEKWWQAIWAKQAALGAETMYVEPEHGPAPYLHTLPYTNVPVTDLWEVNSFIARRVKAKFDAWKAM
jgi:sugar phosphate isomerase/epimerase